jgi:hypothetical protein
LLQIGASGHRLLGRSVATTDVAFIKERYYYGSCHQYELRG